MGGAKYSPESLKDESQRHLFLPEDRSHSGLAGVAWMMALGVVAFLGGLERVLYEDSHRKKSACEGKQEPELGWLVVSKACG